MSREPPAYLLYRFAWTILDWLYPPNCGGCDQLGIRWCGKCNDEASLVPDTVCPSCGRIADQKVGKCYQCQTFQPHFTMVRSWALFEGPVRNVIHRLKYYQDVALGEVLARPLIQMVRKLDWNFDLVSPIPLGGVRMKERGYNQAALLARPIALAQNVKYHPNGLKRVKETQTQVGLSLAQRHSNVKGAFEGLESVLAGKTILLVDDVMTSGATLNACSRAAISAGARDVYCLTLARAK